MPNRYDIRKHPASEITVSVIDGLRNAQHAVRMLTKRQLLEAVDGVAKSRAEMARVLTVAPARITEMFKGERELTFEEGCKLIEHYQLEGAAPPAVTMDPADFARSQGFVMIPEYDIGYSMGGGIVITDQQPKGMVPFQKDWLRGLFTGAVEDLLVARGEGESMEPTLRDGDIVLIDTSQKEIRHQDRIWAVAFGDLGSIKRIRRMPGGSFLILSDNPAVQPQAAAEQDMHVIGRVVWIGRKI